jgi:hypothetical protein
MRKFITKFLDWAFERGIKGNEVSRVDGIALIDIRKRGGSFQTTIENALHLIRQHDPRRYARVKRYISRIVNIILPTGFTSHYDFGTRTVELEFREMPKFTDDERAAIYASVLVDKAILGTLQSSKIMYRPENKLRIARLLITEHNRFLEKLVEADALPFPTWKLLQMELDEKRGRKISKKSFLKVLFSAFWKSITDRKLKTK